MQHGRLKVRTTAEQEEAKRCERAEKVRVYRETTGRIFAKVSTQHRAEVRIEELEPELGWFTKNRVPLQQHCVHVSGKLPGKRTSPTLPLLPYW